MFVLSSRSLRKLAALLIISLASGFSVADTAKPVVAERIDLIRHGESADNADKGKMITRIDGSLIAKLVA